MKIKQSAQPHTIPGVNRRKTLLSLGMVVV